MSDKVITIDLDEITKRMDIVVSANSGQLEDIKTCLQIKDDNIKKLAKDIYKLSIRCHDIKTIGLIDHFTIEDMTSVSEEREAKIKDFVGSEEFYKKATRRKGYKIISDDFSDERSRELYSGFQSIEARWRKFILFTSYANTGLKFPKSKNHNKSSPDHAISMYELSDFLEVFLYQSASDEYIERVWIDSKRSTQDVLKVSKLTKLDELSFPLNKEQLETIRKVRNQCMHFRVLSLNDYESVVPLINTYLKKDEWDKFIKTFKSSMDTMMKELIPSAASIAQSMQPLVASQMPSIVETVRNISLLVGSFAMDNIAVGSDKKKTK